MLKDPKPSEMHWIDSPAHCMGGKSEAPNQTLYRNLIGSTLGDSCVGRPCPLLPGRSLKGPDTVRVLHASSSMPVLTFPSGIQPHTPDTRIGVPELWIHLPYNTLYITSFKATTNHLSIFPNLFDNKGTINTCFSPPGCMLETWVQTLTKRPDTCVHSYHVHNGPKPGKD